MRKVSSLLLLMGLVFQVCGQDKPTKNNSPYPAITKESDYWKNAKLVWSDEFDGDMSLSVMER